MIPLNHLCSYFQGFLLCPALEGDYYDFYINLQNNITPDGCTNETVFIYYGSIAV